MPNCIAMEDKNNNLKAIISNIEEIYACVYSKHYATL